MSIFNLRVFLIIAISNLCQSFITHAEQKITESVVEELNIKSLVIVKGDDLKIDNIIRFGKLISQKKLFVTYMSDAQMIDTIYEHNKLPMLHKMRQLNLNPKNVTNYRPRQEYEYVDVKEILSRSRPKTVVLVYGENIEVRLAYLFYVSLTKYV